MSRHALTICVILMPSLAVAEIESDIPLGVEVVTGYRTHLVQRGFLLGEDVIDVQLQSEVAINNEWSVGFGALHATESGSSGYEETHSFVEIRRDTEKYSYGMSVGYRDVTSDAWRDGWETGVFAGMSLAEDWDLNGRITYDDAARGWYGEADVAWSQVINDKSFVSLTAGAGLAANYYGRDGLHDLFTRFSYTYQVASNVSITPFLGASAGVHEDTDDQVYGGVWFEVVF